MRNARRRKDMLILCLLFGDSAAASNREHLRMLASAGPLPFLNTLYQMHESSVPSEVERKKEVDALRSQVLRHLPPKWSTVDPEIKLWFATNTVHRLVSSGWELPTNGVENQFVQQAYDLSHTINIRMPLSEDIRKHVDYFVNAIRQYGYFAKRSSL